jgi:hydrogenase maturation protein HypF
MACSWLVAARGEQASPPDPIATQIEPDWWRAVVELARSGLASPPTTSMGRLFDAVAALCGVRVRINYEGQAAAELESLCDRRERDAYPLPLLRNGRDLVLDPRPAVDGLARELQRGVPAALVAARFHNAVSAATARACIALAGQHELDTVVLAGGCFQNRMLLESVAGTLSHAGLRVLVPERLPTNDGGISYGQAAVAAARLDFSD